MKNKIVTLVGAFLAIAFAVWGGIMFCIQTDLPDAQLYTLIPVYIVSIFLGVFVEEFVHEGAHFLIGAICSMGVQLPKIRLFKSSSVDLCPKGVKGMKGRFLVTVCAGLFFDFLLIVLGVISFSVPKVPPILGIASPYALYSFIINVVPLEYAQGKTDGLVAWEMITKKDTAKVLLHVLLIQGSLRAGKLMTELDEGLFLDVPQLPEDDLNFILLTQLRYEYYLAKNDDSEAYKYFARYQQLIQYLPSEYKDGKK